MELLKTAILPICSLYKMDFCDVVEQHDDAARESTNTSLDFVLSDPPYNMRRIQRDANAGHSSFMKAHLVSLVFIDHDVMCEGCTL